MQSGKLKVNDTILCMVPESGRFITSYMQLTVTGNTDNDAKKYPLREIESPELVIDKNET